MYELKGEWYVYVAVVAIYYMLVVLLCTMGSTLAFSVGFFLGVAPYVVIGTICMLCTINREPWEL